MVAQRPGKQLPDLPPPPRVHSGTTARLDRRAPTVTLTRLQSGTGHLEMVMIAGASSGDLAFGCAYEFIDGSSGALQRAANVTNAPGRATLPILQVRAQESGELLDIDLRQVRKLRRVLVYGYSPAGRSLQWDGVLAATTYGGARIEIPIEHGSFVGTMAMATVYVVDGELVVRAEMEPFGGPPEMGAVAYGYDIGWLDGVRPIAPD